MDPQKNRTFFRLAIDQYKANIVGIFSKADTYRQMASRRVGYTLSNFHYWIMENKWMPTFYVALICGIGFTLCFFIKWRQIMVENGMLKPAMIDAIIEGVLAWVLSSFVAGLVVYVVFFAFDAVTLAIFAALKAIGIFIISLPFIPWIPFYALFQTILVIGKLLVLIPLLLLFIATRTVQLVKGIFFTCPNRKCTYRGLPAYVCEECGASNHRLWPNLYGLLRHRCIRCTALLPTLDILGKKRLARRCGNPDCDIPLLGRHVGKARERLVGIIGGVSSGKTHYLLMAVNKIVSPNSSGKPSLSGEIDDPTQKIQFRQEWLNLSAGLTAPKTVEVASAFLLYMKKPSKFQLYLYDAPGEEFQSIKGMSYHQHLPLLEGIIFMVDPYSFQTIRKELPNDYVQAPPLQETVDSMLNNLLNKFQVVSGQKVPLRIALVISKADLEPVTRRIGDIRQGPIPGEQCRKAICAWGGENEVVKIEQRFDKVAYFACSALGRKSLAGDKRDKRPFEGAGVLAPLAWVLNQEGTS